MKSAVNVSLDELRRLVREARRKRGLSQTQAAGLIGHTQKWLSDFERGKSDPPSSMLLTLLTLLGLGLTVTIDEPGEAVPEDAFQPIDFPGIEG